MKKVIIIGPAYPLRGGLASFNERMAQVMQDEGYSVTIYTFSLQYPGFLFPGKTQYSEDPPPKDLNIKVKINSINPFNWIKVGREIKRLQPDWVICRFWLPFMGPCLGTILRVLRKKKGTRIMGFVDNIVPHEKRLGDFVFAKYFVKSCDSFLVMSKTVKEQLRTFTKQKPVAFAEHPISDNFGQPVSYDKGIEHLGLSTEYKYLLFFGFIRDYKGLDILLEAMADERIKKMKIKLIVAGEYYSNAEKYKKKIASLNIANQLILRTDFIPNADVKYYFSVADLVTQPYKTATQSGISSLAYFFEKPMVVTKVGGLPELVRNDASGYVVEVDPTAIANAIVNYFEKNKKESFVQEVIADKKIFSWENLIRSMEQAIT